MGLAAQAQTLTDILRFPLPDALRFQSGEPVRDGNAWKTRRSEIVKLFADQVYGRTPEEAGGLRSGGGRRVQGPHWVGLQNQALFRVETIEMERGGKRCSIHVLLCTPLHAKGPVPVIAGLNFGGNQTVSADAGIPLPEIWVRDHANGATGGIERSALHKERAPESSRGQAASQWQLENIIAHGYGLATAYYGDIEPDFATGIGFGVRSLFLEPGESEPAADAWGALGAWAWGLSRMADLLESDGSIDAHHIALFGFSRLGKAALWAAAQDERFRLVISNESGVGGASLFRAKSGETIEHLNTAFPHWFCANFHQYTGRPNRVPVDGNLLLALIAPRPLYVASAEGDLNSNPAAEFLSTITASKVYSLLGREGLTATRMPEVNQPVRSKSVAYHVRSGKHGVTAFDWDQYLRFIHSQWKEQPR